MWNEWLRARLPCNHSLANARRSAIDSAPPLSTAQGICLPGLTVAYALPSESCVRARAERVAFHGMKRRVRRHGEQHMG